MITEKKVTLDGFFDYKKQSYISWQLDRTHIRKVYVLEYCDDERKFERLGLLPEYGGLELDDVFHSITFTETEDNTDTFEGIVMENYLGCLFNPKILDVKLWEQIYDGDTMIQERWIQPPTTFYHQHGKQVTDAIMTERDRLRKENEELEKEVEMMRRFIKSANAEKWYQEFRDKEENNED